MNIINTSKLWFLLLIFLMPISVQARATTYTATAEFFVNPTGCIFTSANVTVVQTRTQTTGSPTTTVTAELDYVVKSVCDEPGDNLFYHVISTEGAVEIDPADFSINPHLNSAELHTTLPVFDDEAGSNNSLRVHVVWSALNRSGNVSVRAATASFDAPAAENPFLVGFGVITNPIATSVSAELRR